MDVSYCYPLLMQEDDDQQGRVEHLGGLLIQPSNQPIDPTTHQISFFACRCRVPSIVENVPD
jgi:hypothetical protein